MFERRKDRIIVYAVCLVPASVASVWLYLWLQWALPTEGGTLEGFALLCGLLLIGIVLGNSHRPALTRRAAWLLRAAALFSFASLCFWFDYIAWPVRLADTVPVAAGYGLGRVWAYFFRGEWWIPFVVSLVPPLLALALIKPDTKQGWPWRSFQTQILTLRSNAEAALDRLHLPRDRALTEDEYRAWAGATPLKMDLRFSLTGRSVSVSIVDPSTKNLYPERYAWMGWGYDTFGPIDPRTMNVLWASD